MAFSVRAEPLMALPVWTEHLHRQEAGKFSTLQAALGADEADVLYDLCKAQLLDDKIVSDDWTNTLTENASVHFKPDINRRGSGPGGRIKHETRVSLNLGQTYYYTGSYHAGRDFSDTELGQFIEERLLDKVGTWAAEVEDVAPGPPNNVLINYYKNGASSIGAHSDRVAVNKTPATDPVFMISLGAERDWKIVKKDTKAEVVVRVTHGQAAIMSEPMQGNYTHELPPCTTSRAARPNLIRVYNSEKFGTSAERFSLTFRWLKEPTIGADVRARMAQAKKERLATLTPPSTKAQDRLAEVQAKASRLRVTDSLDDRAGKTLKTCGRCEKPAQFLCGGCASESYCGQTCQRADWLLAHRVVCFSPVN